MLRGWLFPGGLDFEKVVGRTGDKRAGRSSGHESRLDRNEFPFKESYGGECPGVYCHRLQRDGWKMVRGETGKGDDHIRVFEKVLPKGWILEKSAHASINHLVGKGCYYDTHRLLRSENGHVLDCAGWDLVELDRKRLVWAEKGILRAATIHGTGLGAVKDLLDLSSMEFEAIQAPY